VLSKVALNNSRGWRAACFGDNSGVRFLLMLGGFVLVPCVRA